MSEREVYLGDGLYASWDGWQVKLRAPREGGDHEVFLEDGLTLQAFFEFLDTLPIKRPSFEPDVSKPGRLRTRCFEAGARSAAFFIAARRASINIATVDCDRRELS